MDNRFWTELIPRAQNYFRHQPDPVVRLVTLEGDSHQIGLHSVAVYLTAAHYPNSVHLGQSIENLISLITPDIRVVMVSGLLQTNFLGLIPLFEQLNRMQVKVPFILGGGMLTEKFVAENFAGVFEGPVYFAKKPENGIDIVSSILANKPIAPICPQELKGDPPVSGGGGDQKWVPAPIPDHIDFDRHIEFAETLDSLWNWISPRSLYQLHLGFRGNFVNMLARGDLAAVALHQKVESVKQKIRKDPAICCPRAVYQFFKIRSEGNSILVLDKYQNVQLKIDFPRQSGSDHRCLTDWISPFGDIMPFLVTTVSGAKATSAHWFITGNFEESLILQHLACQMAEAYAEKLHYRLRNIMNISTSEFPKIDEIENANYQGKRYSFGYPACPDLSSQRFVFDLLNPAEIGVTLSSGFMMDPEASVSAFVLHHPQARYFGVVS